MKNRMRVEFDSISANEAFARVVVAAFMAQLNPSMEEVADVKTAVSEAVTNAIIHGYQGQVHTVEICGETEGRRLTVQIKDTGVGIPDVERPWSLFIPHGRRPGVPAWAFSLWRPLWMKCRWNRSPGRAPA